MSFIELNESDRSCLLSVARESIQYYLLHREAIPLQLDDFSDACQQQAASFVTLKTRDGALQGCIGSLITYRPLILDVADHAQGAAFRDSRFPPLSADRWVRSRIEISVLSPTESLDVHSEEELLTKLHPMEDGLVLDDGTHRATFLPKVWAQLPEPEDFVRQLKMKAGIPIHAWPKQMSCSTYHCVDFAELA